MVFTILGGDGTFSSKASRLGVVSSPTLIKCPRGSLLVLVHCVLKYVMVHLADRRGTPINSLNLILHIKYTSAISINKNWYLSPNIFISELFLSPFLLHRTAA